MNSTELLAPAGNFQIAIAALESGADAVYVGLKSFSARKSATNLEYSELLRLKNYALNNNKKIYVPINTIIKEEEIPIIYKTLCQLSDAQVDSVIIQDIGLLNFIKQYFPHLTIHASTQMAIHNLSGVKILQQLGIGRAVLSRELSLEEIANIRRQAPKMELEIFIHGALCYSFSGMCLASGLSCNRSGNRGECAQICRSYFKHLDTNKYLFSCNDLFLGQDILKLKELGVHSLKIEGRMKNKNYVQKTVSLYREILDTPKLNMNVIENLSQQTALTFARQRTSGYLYHSSGSTLINNNYPGHLGIQAGHVQNIKGNKVTLKLTHPIAKNNTILFLNKDIDVTPHILYKLQNHLGKNITNANVGELVQIDITGTPPTRGTIFYLTKSNQSSSNDIDHKKIPLFKHSLPAKLCLTNNCLELSCEKFNYKKEIEVQAANKQINFEQLFQEYLNQSGTSLYQLQIEKFDNQTSWDSLFLPPFELKKIKNEIYQNLEASVEKKVLPKREITFAIPSLDSSLESWIEKRANLNPLGSDLPFAQIDDIKQLKLASFAGLTFVPLFPILIQEDDYFQSVLEMITTNPQIKFVLGINNLSHLSLATSLKLYSNVSFFLDFYIYVANFSTLDFFKEQLTDFLFAYSWVEHDTTLNGTVKMKDNQKLPLFISRGCFHRHNVFQGKCPEKCQMLFQATLNNGKRQYSVRTQDCISFFFNSKQYVKPER